MYAGKIVEIGTAEEIFYDPRHPYTWGLLGALPSQAVENGELRGIPGMPPTLLDPPPGDAFAERNQYAMKIDYERMPPMFPVSETHSAATWLLDERGARGRASRHHQTPRYDPLKNPVLLSVRNYKQHFPINKSLTVYAVNGISFDLRKGEIFGLVGESGCGKSTVARAIMGIYTPTGRRDLLQRLSDLGKALLPGAQERYPAQYAGYLPGLRGGPESTHEGCRHHCGTPGYQSCLSR